MPCFDLHTHSTASDGTLAPAALMQQAAQAGVQVIALTDHDTTAGLADAQNAADQLDLTLIPGVEISASWRDCTLHIVGLQITVDHPTLQQGLTRLATARTERARQISQQLHAAGITGDWYTATQQFGQSIGRPHFARALVAAGHATTVPEAFKKFLQPGKAGYVPGTWASLAEVVHWIQAAGGQAVLAHPARYRLKQRRLRQLLEAFVTARGTGIEVIAGNASAEETRVLAHLARDYHLLASVGSDYHGPGLSARSLGVLPALPTGCTPVWQHWPSTSNSTAHAST
ncbi:MAG: PHP domain-containing protein [Pseudomonadota bacterium]